MCNRISTPSASALRAQYLHLNVPDFETVYHSFGFDHQLVPVLTNLAPNTIQLARWGFVPDNARHEDDLKGYEGGTLNARCETLFETQLYRDAAPIQRCIIFVNGFFEFKSVSGKKYPHFISNQEGKTFTFGGVWNEWNTMLTFSIITTPANELMAEIHNEKMRMPFILQDAYWNDWLDINKSRAEIEAMMKPYPHKDLKAWPVSNLLTQKGANKNVPEVQLRGKSGPPASPLSLF